MFLSCFYGIYMPFCLVSLCPSLSVSPVRSVSSSVACLCVALCLLSLALCPSLSSLCSLGFICLHLSVCFSYFLFQFVTLLSCVFNVQLCFTCLISGLCSVVFPMCLLSDPNPSIPPSVISHILQLCVLPACLVSSNSQFSFVHSIVNQ